MRMLTVRQPWASALVRLHDPKTIENRLWATRHRGRLGIHAGAAIDKPALAVVANASVADLSVVVGVVEVLSCHREGSPECDLHECGGNKWAMWSTDPFKPMFHWVVGSGRKFVTPIRAKGALGLWAPSPSVDHLMSIGEFK